MKKTLFLILLAALSINCKSQSVGQISKSDLKENLTYLASDELKGRRTGSEGIDKAADFLIQKLESYGIEPYFENYRDPFDLQGEKGANVVGYIPGTDPELKDQLVILGAHYDHIGVIPDKAVEGDSIANGANDDGSGVVTVLEIARVLAKKDHKRGILIAFFSGEEQGLLGSTHLAKRLAKEDAKAYAMLNFEMLGVPMKSRDYRAYLTGYNKSNMAEEFNRYAGGNVLGYLKQAASMNLFKRSDNYAFYKELNIPAQTICTFDFTNFDYYHHVDDEVDKVDFGHISRLIKKTLPALEKLIDDPTDKIKMLND
jgi:Zn-dependent M28 family amino/carboxypeptidase